jgi:hypothetical protein
VTPRRRRGRGRRRRTPAARSRAARAAGASQWARTPARAGRWRGRSAGDPELGGEPDRVVGAVGERGVGRGALGEHDRGGILIGRAAGGSAPDARGVVPRPRRPAPGRGSAQGGSGDGRRRRGGWRCR